MIIIRLYIFDEDSKQQEEKWSGGTIGGDKSQENDCAGVVQHRGKGISQSQLSAAEQVECHHFSEWYQKG